MIDIYVPNLGDFIFDEENQRNGMEWYKSKKKEACQSLKAYFKLESRWQKWENIDHFIKRF